MRRPFLFCLMMLAASPAAGAPDYSRLEYFPAELHMSRVECQLGPKRMELPLLSDFHDAWFSKHLAAAKEPSLFEQSLKPPQDMVASYRFTWLRSFHAPIIVRIDEERSGVMQLTAKRLSGQGGYDPGHLDGVINRPLTAKEGEDVHRAFLASDFATFRPNPCDIATDGAQWVVEARAGGKYRVVHQQSPQKGPIGRIDLVLLSLTNWKIGLVY
jgi:hypothetical protein